MDTDEKNPDHPLNMDGQDDEADQGSEETATERTTGDITPEEMIQGQIRIMEAIKKLEQQIRSKEKRVEQALEEDGEDGEADQRSEETATRHTTDNANNRRGTQRKKKAAVGLKNEKRDEDEESEEIDEFYEEEDDPYHEIPRQTVASLNKRVEELELQIRREEMRTANQNRRIILKFILGLFAIWIILSLIRLMITGDIQVLTAGAAVLSGPLGVVIGYYYAQEDKGHSKHSYSQSHENP